MFAISRAERWPVIESSAGASSPPVPLKEWQSEQPLLSKSCAPLFGSPIAVTARLGPPTCPEGTDGGVHREHAHHFPIPLALQSVVTWEALGPTGLEPRVVPPQPVVGDPFGVAG